MENEQSNGIPMSYVIFHFEPDYVHKVILRALEHRSGASDSVRDTLNSALADTVRLDGFHDASKAQPQQLADTVLLSLKHGNHRLAAGVFRSWTESREDLRNVVTEHLTGADIPVDGPNYRERTFGSTWDWDEWSGHVDAITGNRDDLVREDVGMMLCCVSGRMPKFGEDHFEFESDDLHEWIDHLDELPHDAPEWDEIEDFIDAVAQIAKRKAVERDESRVRELTYKLDAIRSEFDAELQYLDVDISSWNEQAAERSDPLDGTMELAIRLYNALALYSPVRQQAESRAEEAERAPERARHEGEILQVVRDWDSLMSAPDVDDDQADSQREVDEEPAQPDAPEPEPAVSKEEHEAALAELDRLRREGESLSAENARLAQANAGLEADREALDKERDELRDELSLSRDMEKTWRDSYVAAQAAGAGDSGDAMAQPETVNEAIALAERTFSDQLVFALNSKSDKNSQFQKPNEVFDALAWLATVYRERRVRPVGTPHFDKLLKEACSGWSYKPGQTEVTREQFIDWYTATVDGVRYDLSHHLAKGNSRDPRSTIRIAFAWDEERKQVIVGFLGLHQRNRRT